MTNSGGEMKTDKQLADIGAKVHGWELIVHSPSYSYYREKEGHKYVVATADGNWGGYDPANDLVLALKALIVWNASASRKNQLGFHINPSNTIDIEYCKQDGVWRELNIDSNALNESPRKIMELIAERMGE